MKFTIEARGSSLKTLPLQVVRRLYAHNVMVIFSHVICIYILIMRHLMLVSVLSVVLFCSILMSFFRLFFRFVNLVSFVGCTGHVSLKTTGPVLTLASRVSA